MDVEQQREWMALRAAAESQLRSGDWRVRLAILGAFDAPVVLGVRRSRSSEWSVEKRSWDLNADLRKFETPVKRLAHPRSLQPTISTTATDISEHQLEDLVHRLEAISIPAFPSTRHAGLDGMCLEVLVSEAFTSVTYQWWASPPPQWRPLGEWFQHAWKTLSDAFANGSPPHAPSG